MTTKKTAVLIEIPNGQTTRSLIIEIPSDGIEEKLKSLNELLEKSNGKILLISNIHD